MSGETWTLPNGQPMKFQDGDYVRISTEGKPERAHTLPFLEGYVRGYDAFTSGEKTEVGYELHSMGNSPLCGVKEEVLEKVPERLPHTCHGRICGICGAGGTPQGLSIFAGPPVDKN